MNDSTTEIYEDANAILHRAKFIILLVLEIVAITLSILIFIFFAKHHAPFRALQNQGLVILLIVNSIQLLFDIPLSLRFYAHAYVSPATPSYCSFWTFFEYVIYASSAYILATISVQRHIFIFHRNVLQTQWKKYILHDLPLVLAIIYPVIFYIFAIYVYPCDGTQWDYHNNLCGFANCYLLYNKVLGTYDMVVNDGVPMIIDISANITLILRVHMKKHRSRQRFRWRQQRQMVLQLLCLSTLYLVGWTPCIVVEVIQIVVDPTFLASIQTGYFYDLIYSVYLFFPFLFIGFIPEVITWMKQLFYYRLVHNMIRVVQRRNTVEPIQLRSNIRSTARHNLITTD